MDTLLDTAESRTSRRLSAPTLLPILLLIVALLLGCGNQSSVTTSDPQMSHVAAISGILAKYQYMNRGQPIDSEEALLLFVNEKCRDVLNRHQYSDARSLLFSQRDGLPIVVLYGGSYGTLRDGAQVVCYEAEGRDGTRMIGLLGGGFRNVDDVEFDAMRSQN